MGTRYERAFGTEWTSLSTDQIIHRAYALGVSETLGDELEGEYDRLQHEVAAAHDRDIVELAYREGRREALELKRRSPDGSSVWDDLVDEPVTRGGTVEALPDGLPSSLDRSDLLDRPSDEIDAVELPTFLRRDS